MNRLEQCRPVCAVRKPSSETRRIGQYRIRRNLTVNLQTVKYQIPHFEVPREQLVLNLQGRQMVATLVRFRSSSVQCAPI
jgi:hypothetical protein